MLRAYISGAYWRHGFSFSKALAALLSSFGVLWLVMEIANFFVPNSDHTLQGMWPWFLLLGLAAAIWTNRPVHSVSCKLTGRDVALTICAGDIFSMPGAVVVGTNTTFDTDISSGLINKASIQGQFTEKFYDSVSHLNSDITAALFDVPSDIASPVKRGKQDVYPVGTVAQVVGKGRTAYLLVIAELNGKGVANATFDDLKTALPALWEFVANSGTIEPIVIPVLGSGFSRLPETREEIVREIVNSFIAGCSARRFTESLTIVMHPKDFYKHSVDLAGLGQYLGHVCRYSEYGAALRPGRGTPAS